jgi:hypothetical protein
MSRKPLPEIKPCPFCGRAPLVEPWYTGGKCLVSCENKGCVAAPSVIGRIPSEATRKWNTRARARARDIEAERRGVEKAIEWLCRQRDYGAAIQARRLTAGLKRGKVLPAAKRGKKP